jgi:hypothetical protein
VSSGDFAGEGGHEASGFNGDGAPGRDAPGSASRARKDLHAVWRAVRSLPGTLQSGMKTHPTAVLAGVGAATFVLGTLCGSRVGRLLTTTLVGYGVRRLVEGPVAREVARYATQVMRNADARAAS